ncbi:hypothetical protein HYW60_02150 [Candidatus Kaiserbacteria bacterium]|nr:hypothetical protein [Candidatus Kaiserbacteria bacterium]
MFFHIVIAFALLFATPAQTDTVRTDHIVHMGDTTVTLREFHRGEGPTFIRVHHNEIDAGVVGERLVAELGGRFIDLIHARGRMVSFRLGTIEHEFDPNRIFTHEGIVRTLRASGPIDPKAYVAVQSLADRILALCASSMPLVALHNNAGRGYGILSYAKVGLYYRGNGKTFVHIGAGGAYNFVIVTTEDLFAKFTKQNVSVVYQDPAHDINDGSLSYRYGKDGKSYINVETLLGKRDVQWQMVRDIHGMLMKATAASLQ